MRIQNIASLYNIAFFTTFALCVLIFFVLDATVKNYENNASVINVSGRQRMLSQRTAFLATQLSISTGEQETRLLQTDLMNTAELMEGSHDTLVFSTLASTKSKQHIMPESLKALYFGSETMLDQKLRSYISQAKALASEDFAVDHGLIHQQYIANNSNEILLLLDKAVGFYEAEYKGNIARLRLMQKIILGINLAMMMAQQILIFRPAARTVMARNKELQEAKQEAEKIAQFPLNNPHPLIQIGFDSNVIFANPATTAHYPGLEKMGFEHPVLGGLDVFMDNARRNKNEKHNMTREITYNDIVYHQTVSAVITNGQPALVVYCYDITDIKHAQQKARLLETAIDSAQDGLIITTADTEAPKIIYVNDAITRISGYEAHELIGQTPGIFQCSGTNRKALDQLKEALKKGLPYKGELQNYTKSGKAYWLGISIVPVHNERGEVTHFAAIERDITERKAFEKEMQINREAAEVANRAKGDFLANMSHELRTPMNGIIGLSELLMEMDLGQEKQELADAINSSSRSLLILLNDILDLSKIEAGELTLEHIPFDTRKTILQTIDLLRPIASRKGVVLDSTINSIVPDALMGDPARLQQILNNLMSNAIKFTEVGYVRLDVSSSRDSSGDPVLHIRVEDTGIGIPEDKRQAIFQKFTQADVSTARKYGGTGLGLAITKELVDMMGGRISLDSMEGRGTTFYVEIPVELARESDLSKNGKSSETAGGFDNTAKVMVVDDHPVNLLFMRKVLKKLGFKDVEEACCGREAIEKVEQQKYDLIFMDCQMPEIDGFEASTIIREREDLIGDIRIVAVTADAMKGAREKCLDAGMNDYISKPIDMDKLNAILVKWLPGESTADDLHVDESICNELPEDAQKAPIMDWARLELFSDGNADEERELISIFTTYAEETLEMLKMHAVSAENERWKQAAHKLKGSAANLGAQSLSAICYEAEKLCGSGAEEKQELLSEILCAYHQVIVELDNRRENSKIPA